LTPSSLIKRLTTAVTVGVFILAAWHGPGAHGKAPDPADVRAAKAFFKAADRRHWKTARRHAAKAKDPVVATLFAWTRLSARNSGASFNEIAEFIRRNPDWPLQTTLRRRAEEAMTVGIDPAQVRDWFDGRDPVTTDGWVRLGAALLAGGRTDEARAVLRKTWVQGTFGKRQQRTFYKKYRKHLTKQDHIDRLERLLWKGHYWPVKRMLYRVGKDHRALAEARIALRHRRGNVDTPIARVPKSLRNDPGLIYERVRWRRRKGKDKSARELLESVTGPMPEAGRWWTERAILARQALRDGYISEAYRLAKNHGTDGGASFAAGEWLAGWIALRFLGDHDEARGHFERMYHAVKYPISRARAAYWLARAYEALDRHKAAHEWYGKAAVHPTAYYGQLAAARLNPDAILRLPPRPIILTQEAEDFERHPLVHAMNFLAEIKQRRRLRPFAIRLGELRDTPGWRSMATTLARDLDRPDLAIRVAKKAIREGQDLVHAGYPTRVPPPQKVTKRRVAVEMPLVMSVIRQESLFQVNAVSSAGARGLMQLMPATARRTAGSLRLRYSKAKLTRDPDYNIKLGQAYLGTVIKQFNGSYVLALAGYNAGPHRAKRWIRANGDPRDTLVDAVDWIEMIPFAETRNYVQRVLENLQIYRARMAKTKVALNLENDLMR